MRGCSVQSLKRFYQWNNIGKNVNVFGVQLDAAVAQAVVEVRFLSLECSLSCVFRNKQHQVTNSTLYHVHAIL